MTKLHLLSLCLIGLSTPTLAQISLTLPSDSSSSAAPAATSSSMAPDDTSASEETSDDQPVAEGPAVPSKDALTDLVKTCTDISSGDPKAADRINADGWTPDDATSSGPYRHIYSGSKDMSGYGSVTIWGSVDTYPSQMLGYCRVDFGDYDNLINFADMTGLQGLTGSVTTPDSSGNVYGAWETADKKILVISDRTDGQVEIEFNLLLGDKK
jgi:hypothetical protein